MQGSVLPKCTSATVSETHEEHRRTSAMAAFKRSINGRFSRSTTIDYGRHSSGAICGALGAYIRTSNPVESAFSSIRLRTAKTRNCGSRETTLSMVFKLAQSAEKRWRKLKGYKLLGDVVQGIRFKDGIREQIQSGRIVA